MLWYFRDGFWLLVWMLVIWGKTALSSQTLTRGLVVSTCCKNVLFVNKIIHNSLISWLGSGLPWHCLAEGILVFDFTTKVMTFADGICDYYMFMISTSQIDDMNPGDIFFSRFNELKCSKYHNRLLPKIGYITWYLNDGAPTNMDLLMAWLL